MTLPVKPIDEIEVKATVSADDKILILDSDTDEARLASKDELKGDKWDQWDPWTPWAAATIAVGTTSTLSPWSSATVTNSGTSSAAVFNFGIPKWDQWATGNWIVDATSSKVWKTTTVTLNYTNGGSDSFTVQDGLDGTWSWDVSWPASSTDGHLAVFDWVTWKLIKDWWVVPTGLPTLWSDWQVLKVVSGVAAWATPPSVVDSLNSTSTTDALSANQWYILNGKINDLMAQGKFLSLWDSSTWQPISFPLTTPYTYNTWDYFMVETIDTWGTPTNYRPDGSSYSGTASTTTESWEVAVWDYYVYDGSVWLLATNHGKTVSFANLAWDAMDNVNLSWYLNMKAFYLSSTSDLTTAQAAFEWQNGGKTAIIIYNSKPYAFSFYNTAQMDFVCLLYREQLDAGNNKTSLVRDVITLSVTGGTTVSSISANARNNVIASVLKTDTDYSTPYTPQYNGSPATKKYVDDHAFAPSWTATTWYVVTKTADGYEWAAPSGWDVMVSSQSWNILTSWMKIRAGTQSDYENLGTYDNNTVYLTIE